MPRILPATYAAGEEGLLDGRPPAEGVRRAARHGQILEGIGWIPSWPPEVSAKKDLSGRTGWPQGDHLIEHVDDNPEPTPGARARHPGVKAFVKGAVFIVIGHDARWGWVQGAELQLSCRRHGRPARSVYPVSWLVQGR